MLLHMLLKSWHWPLMLSALRGRFFPNLSEFAACGGADGVYVKKHVRVHARVRRMIGQHLVSSPTDSCKDKVHMDGSRPGALSAVDQAQLRQIVEQAHARLRDGDAHSALQVCV